MPPGSGFVAAPGYVMANRHVAGDEGSGVADATGLPGQADATTELHGTVIGIDTTLLR